MLLLLMGQHAVLEMANVLVVASSRDGQAERITGRLQRDGFEVIACPGPHAPTFICPGIRDAGCGFAGAADVVVLDGWLDSDVERRGIPWWHLLRFYRTQGLPVLALIGPDGLPAPIYDPGVATLPRDATASEISGAVRSMCEERSAASTR